MKTLLLKIPEIRLNNFIKFGAFCLILALTACSQSGNKKSRANLKPADPPVYVVNGRVLTGDTARTIVPRLKHKYIDELHVIAGEKAKLLFGEKAKGGAIVYKMSHEKKAFHDLRPRAASDSIRADTTKVYNFADQQPVLKGGLKKLQKEVNYPDKCKQAGAKGRVLVQVVVDKQGRPVNPKLIKGLGHGCDKEALRVVKTARFVPGKMEGKPVKVKYLMQIVFPPNK